MFTWLIDPGRVLDAGASVVRTAASSTVAAGAAVAAAARQGRSVAEKVRQEASPAWRALLDLRPRRAHRRVWTGEGQAHIEVRGMTGRGPTHRRLAAGVTRRLNRLRGVR
jgi:cation-transporting ATPase I